MPETLYKSGITYILKMILTASRTCTNDIRSINIVSSTKSRISISIAGQSWLASDAFSPRCLSAAPCWRNFPTVFY
jgi:hypothetical protein